MRFSRSCLRCEGFRYEYDVTRPMPPTARKKHGRLMADAKLREIPWKKTDFQCSGRKTAWPGK